MSNKELQQRLIAHDYLSQLKKLDLQPHSYHTAAVLGLKHRQLARLAAGTTEPSLTLQRLLAALIKLKDL